MQETPSSRDPSRDLLTRSSMTVRNAVSVFPLPVGEQSRRWFPSMIWGIAIFWGSVKSGKRSRNHSLTGWQSLSINSSVEEDSFT